VGKPGAIVVFVNVYFKGAPADYMIAKLSQKDKKALIEISAFNRFDGFTPS